MTKRIVSGIFILAALGALGVILAGALTSGEQLIVRFLTAVIVAALGLYVISDLRMQAEQAEEPGDGRTVRRAGAAAPANSTAAYMATVTNSHTPGSLMANHREIPPDEHRLRPPRPVVALVSADDTDRDIGKPGRGSTPPPLPADRPRPVRSGPPPMPPGAPTPGPSAPMEPVTKARGGLEVADATATAPIPITRWTSGETAPDPSDGARPLGQTSEIAPPAGRQAADPEPTVLPTTIDLTDLASDDTDSPARPGTSASSEPGPGAGTGLEPGEGGPVAGNITGSGDATEPIYSHRGSFSYAGDLTTSDASWPPPAPLLPLNEPSPAIEDGGVDPISVDPSVENAVSKSGYVVDLDRRRPAPPDAGSRYIGATSVEADVQTSSDGERTGSSTTIVDDRGAIDHGEQQEAEVDTTNPVADDDLERDDVTNREIIDLDLMDRTGSAGESGQHHLDHGDARPRPDLVVSTGSADPVATEIIDLRVHRDLEPESVAKAIRAGERQVIETLIRQGMLSTSGPITNRDVRTMVYVAFTSNELRKLIEAGAVPDTDRDDLNLGTVELFDERRFAPTPRTLYTPPPNRVDLTPGEPGNDAAASTETAAAGDDRSDGADTAGGDDTSTPTPTHPSTPTPVGSQATVALPKPRHVYRLIGDASPETVA